MKTTTTVADFIKRAREAGHDALGIAKDPESTMGLVAVHRDAFAHERNEGALRRWRALVADVAAATQVDPAMERWLAIEHVRLRRAFELAGLADPSLHNDAARWVGILQVEERNEILRRFEIDIVAPLRGVAVGSQG